MELLKVLLKLTTEKHGVASKVIANSDDLERLAVEGDQSGIPGDVAGIRGRAGAAVAGHLDPRDGVRLSLIETDRALAGDEEQERQPSHRS